MKKLIWKLRYALHMRKRLGVGGLSFLWEQACIAANENPENLEDDPVYVCDEELSYWGE